MENLIIKIAKSEKEIIDAKNIRRGVFQIEQGIDSKLDFDGKDGEADLVGVYLSNKAIGTARIRYIENNNAKVERVAVLKEFRGNKSGVKIMEFIAGYLLDKNIEKIILDSQLQAKSFYEKLGYFQEGNIFEEVGIPHVVMLKKLK